MVKRILLFLLLFINGLQAQKTLVVEGTIKGFHGGFMNLELPNLGVDIGGNEQKLTIYEVKELDRFEGEFEVEGEGFMGFYHYRTSSYVRYWVSPEGVNGMNYDWEKPKETSSFYGVTKAENELLTKFDLEREKYTVPKQSFSRSTLTSLQTKELELLTAAFNQKSVSEAFYRVMKEDIKYFWWSLAEEKKIKFRNSLDPTDLSNPNILRTRNFLNYLHHYFARKSEQDGLLVRYEKATRELKDKKMLEAYWAFDMLQVSSTEENDFDVIQTPSAKEVDFDIIQAYELFKEAFPNSNFTEEVAKNIVLIEDDFKLLNSKITKEMVILDKKISLPDLLNQYKGQVVYVDIWATWCKPCIEEMKPRFKDPLNEFIKGKSIRIIYLSTDYDWALEKWKEKVREMRLNSVNVRYSNWWKDRIFDFLNLDIENSISLPRYLIIDKNGKLVNGDAPRPSEGKKLYAALAEYL